MINTQLPRMQVIEKKILEVTKSDDFNSALDIIFNDFIKYKIYFLKNENNRYEIKWGMTFNEFEKKSTKMSNGTSYELEQEYYEWEAVITEIEYFKTL